MIGFPNRGQAKVAMIRLQNTTNKQKDICNPDQDFVISLPLYNISGLNTEKRQDQIGKKISSLQSPQIPLHPPQEKDLPIPMNIPCSGKDSIAELL